MGGAQQQFKTMLKERIAPQLRDMGFKGTGQTFTYPDDACFALLGFQKSRHRHAEEVRFTVNLSVVNKAAWIAYEWPRTGTRPKANTSYGGPVWERRIGWFLSEDRDVWWIFDDSTDARELADEVLGAIRDAALPAIREQIRQLGADRTATYAFGINLHLATDGAPLPDGRARDQFKSRLNCGLPGMDPPEQVGAAVFGVSTEEVQPGDTVRVVVVPPYPPQVPDWGRVEPGAEISIYRGSRVCGQGEVSWRTDTVVPLPDAHTLAFTRWLEDGSEWMPSQPM